MPVSGWILIAVLIMAVVVGAFYSMYWTARNDRNKRKQAVKATARIARVGHSRNSTKYGLVLVHLTLEVTPPNGLPYNVDTEWWIKPASTPMVEVGRTVAVKIDHKNPNRIYSGESWASDLNH